VAGPKARKSEWRYWPLLDPGPPLDVAPPPLDVPPPIEPPAVPSLVPPIAPPEVEPIDPLPDPGLPPWLLPLFDLWLLEDDEAPDPLMPLSIEPCVAPISLPVPPGDIVPEGGVVLGELDCIDPPIEPEAPPEAPPAPAWAIAAAGRRMAAAVVSKIRICISPLWSGRWLNA
jgi:hypothetical protein